MEDKEEYFETKDKVYHSKARLRLTLPSPNFTASFSFPEELQDEIENDLMAKGYLITNVKQENGEYKRTYIAPNLLNTVEEKDPRRIRLNHSISLPYIPLRTSTHMLYINWRLATYGIDYEWDEDDDYSIIILKSTILKDQITFIYTIRNNKGDEEITSYTTTLADYYRVEHNQEGSR